MELLYKYPEKYGMTHKVGTTTVNLRVRLQTVGIVRRSRRFRRGSPAHFVVPDMKVSASSRRSIPIPTFATRRTTFVAFRKTSICRSTRSKRRASTSARRTRRNWNACSRSRSSAIWARTPTECTHWQNIRRVFRVSPRAQATPNTRKRKKAIYCEQQTHKQTETDNTARSSSMKLQH